MGYNIGWILVVNSFRNFSIIFCCFVVSMSDLVRDVDALHG